MTRILPLAALVAGCFPGPELPLIDEVPIVAGDACAPSRTETVSCVFDGDTFDVRGCGMEGSERIRLLGIDAPEVEHPDAPGECYAEEARAELERLVAGRRVTLGFDSTCLGVFGRTLAYVWMAWDELDGEVEPGDVPDPGQGLLVNEWLLYQGYARTFDEDFGDPLRLEDRLRLAENSAMARGIGLWSACGDASDAER